MSRDFTALSLADPPLARLSDDASPPTASRVARATGCLLLLAAAAMPAGAANVLLSGNSFDGSNPFLVANLTILDHNYENIPPFLFDNADLVGRDAVWLDGFSHYPGLDSAALTEFVRQGGRLLVQNPGFGSEPLSEYPFGAELQANFVTRNSIRIRQAGHLLNEGLSNIGLSNWEPESAFGYFGSSIGSFTGLTDAGVNGEWITVVRRVGAGLIVYTQQGLSQALSTADFSVVDAELRLLGNALATSCETSGAALCLADGRFRITAGFRAAGSGPGVAQAAAITGDTGYLWFFNPANVETVIKVLPACVPALGNRIWLFAGGLTDVEVTLTATDLSTAVVKTYVNPIGTSFAPIQDTNAFATCP